MKCARELIPTRASLLGRLKDWGDDGSWRDFYETYRGLILGAALKGGLTQAEAEDVLQETVIAVARRMPGFTYHPENGSFKSWLLRLVGWRIADQLRKREPWMTLAALESEDGGEPTVVGRRLGSVLERVWDEEWEANLMRIAVARVKRRVEPKTFQLFDLTVRHGWSVSKVVRDLKVNPARVYWAKSRVSRLLEKEIARLRAE